METYNELYCKIFIDTNIEKRNLINIIKNEVSGIEEIEGSIDAEHFEIDVINNEDFNSDLKIDDDNSFLYYKYYLDIEPINQVTRNEYITRIKNLIIFLKSLNFKVVASCDFEDELSKKTK